MTSNKLPIHKTDPESTVGLEAPPPYTTSGGQFLESNQIADLERMVKQQCLGALDEHHQYGVKNATKSKALPVIILVILLVIVLLMIL